MKEVARVGNDFEIDGDDIDDRYLTYALNEWDEYAIEEAVGPGETHDDVEGIAVTIRPDRVKRTVWTGLAKGADRAIRI